jgi:hypothetical protein
MPSRLVVLASFRMGHWDAVISQFAKEMPIGVGGAGGVAEASGG